MDRFWTKVDKNGPYPDLMKTGIDTRCWVWIADGMNEGYGYFWLDGKMQLAHRVSFFMEHGRWPDPCALHHCDNRACVNPVHLFEGSRDDNNKDKVRKGGQPSGESHYKAKLTNATIAAIREEHANNGMSHRELIVKYNVSQSYLSRLLGGKRRGSNQRESENDGQG